MRAWQSMGFVAATLLLFVHACVVAAQLPQEGVLPGQDRDKPAVSGLPAESLLPTRGPTDRVPTEPKTRPGTTPAGPGSARNLPAEHELPNVAPNERQRQPPLEDRLPLQGSPDGIPWLRLNLAGHTAPIRTMRFSDDGDQIVTAGDDKTVVVWARAAGAKPWRYERTLRWQIQRGSRGRIYVMDSSRDRLAIAGEGALSGNGEILLFDMKTGDRIAALYDEHNGHRQVIVALDFRVDQQGSATGLVSLDKDGRALWWEPNQAGVWRARVLTEEDARSWDAGLNARLAAGRGLAAVGAGPSFAVLPAYGKTDRGYLVWKLTKHDLTTNKTSDLSAANKAPHYASVTAIAFSANNRRMVSTDLLGSLYLWDLSRSPASVVQLRRPPAKAQVAGLVSLGLSADGNRLALGFTRVGAMTPGRVELWDISRPDRPSTIETHTVDDDVLACAVSSDGKTLAWRAGADLVTKQVGAGAPVTRSTVLKPPMRVAFPTQEPFYRIGVSRLSSVNGVHRLDSLFDPQRLRLQRLNVAGETESGFKALPDQWLANGWSVREGLDSGSQPAAWLYEGNNRRARLPLDENFTGMPRATSWLPSKNNKAKRPAAVIVGTSSGNIYVFAVNENGVAKTLRQFRGQTAEVTSLAVSRDLRYFASSGRDGTVRLWPLRGIFDTGASINRWGVEFAMQEGALIANNVREEGPLFFRSVRKGDQIRSLEWIDAKNQKQRADTPRGIANALSSISWRTSVAFEVSTGREQPRTFQLYPSWQPLASLFIADNNEWAYWAPSGYYEASFEGHKLFGWQINRGLESDPDFFLAARFRGVLERPQIMSRLLSAGSVEAAFRQAALTPPANSPEVVTNAYRLKPRVEIMSPVNGERVAGDSLKVRAVVTTLAGQTPTEPKVFANGVGARSSRLVSAEESNGEQRRVYEWTMAAPSDPRLLIQAFAATDNEIAGADSVNVQNDAKPSDRKPRLFLLAVGVDAYRDAQIPTLTTAVSTTNQLASLLDKRASRLYEVETTALHDDRATKPAWNYLTEEYVNRLRQDASPDDLLIILLSGHGVEGRAEDGYQYVTSRARYADIASGRYGDCLSFGDLARFADIPCRKLVILNTCHSGAVNPLEHRELKAAVRSLQNDLMLTLTASANNEEAVEGRFSRRLIEGLQGEADRRDGDADGVTALSELVAYISRTVAMDCASDVFQQTPTAGPAELLPNIHLPLTAVEQEPDNGQVLTD